MPGYHSGFYFTPGLPIECTTSSGTSNEGTGNNSISTDSTTGYNAIPGSPRHSGPFAEANRNRNANPNTQPITQTNHTAITKARSNYMG